MAEERKTGIVAAMLCHSSGYHPKELSGLVKQAESIGYLKADMPYFPWQVYTKGQQFFATAPRDRKREQYVIVQGEAPTETALSDLEIMANGILKGGNPLYNFFVRDTDRSNYGMGVGCAAGIAMGVGVMIAMQEVSSFVAGLRTAVGVVAVTISGGALTSYIGKANDRRLTRGLSDSAVGYNYGTDAEAAIQEECDALTQQQRRGWVHDLITAGLTREEFVNYARVTVADNA